MKMRKIVWSLLTVLLVALLTGCGGGAEESASSQVSLGGEESTGAEDTGQEVIEDVEQVAGEPTATPEPVNAEPQAEPFTDSLGLEQLSSYQADIFLEFEGARGEATDNIPTNQVQEYVLAITRDPQARYQSTYIKAEGGQEVEAESEMYLVDDVTYTNTFDRWIAQGGLLGLSQFVHPARFAPLPETAVCASQPEDVNGISAIPCTFNSDNYVPQSLDAANIQGTVWVAEDGGYVVRYEIELSDILIKGRFEGFSEMDVYKIGYTLSRVNEDIEITLPAEAEGTEVLDIEGMSSTGEVSGLDAPGNAEVIIDNSASLIYFADTPITELFDFHRDSLSAAGWQELPEEGYSEGGSGLAVFENESGLLRVYIFEDLDGGYFVSITPPFDIPDMTGEAAPGGEATGDETELNGDSQDLPVMADAEDEFSMGGIISYSSPSDIETIVKFYQSELPALGWSENEATSFSDGTNAFLTFEQGDQTLLVTVSAGDGGKTIVALTIQ
jgi:hypothetical protein